MRKWVQVFHDRKSEWTSISTVQTRHPEGWSDRPTIAVLTASLFTWKPRINQGQSRLTTKNRTFYDFTVSLCVWQLRKFCLGSTKNVTLIGPHEDLKKIMYCPKFESFQNNSYQASPKTVIPKTITCINILTHQESHFKVQIPGLNQSFRFIMSEGGLMDVTHYVRSGVQEFLRSTRSTGDFDDGGF